MKIRLKALTVRAAKMQVKRLHPKGGTISGYNDSGMLVYHAIVRPQHQKLPGGRTVFSNREEIYRAFHGKKGHCIEWPKPVDFFFEEKEQHEIKST